MDSLSSDVGILSKKPPFDPIRRKRVEPGLSGGMSLLGTVAALVGSAVIAVSLKIHLDLTMTMLVVITGIIFAQTIVDTILGSRIQVKYKCPVCDHLTEKKEHCKSRTVKVAGVSWVDNNMVNLLSSLIVTALAFGILFR